MQTLSVTQEFNTPTTALQRVIELEAALAAMTLERDKLRISYEQLRLELELLKRRLFVAKAERVDTAQLELEFASKLKELDQLSGLSKSVEADSVNSRRKKSHAHGRRDLRQAVLEEERVEISDPLFEELVSAGKAIHMGYEESCKLAYKRGGMRRLVVARVKYLAQKSNGETEIETTPMPRETFSRSLASPSMLAHIVTSKYCDGMPLYRLEDRFIRDGFSLDRGTMSRWLEDAGATLGSSVVSAAREEALQQSFCIATDATGVSVQPEPLPEKKRQPCRRGHYFVLIADRDHIFFEYTPKETSQVVSEMFTGYSGYIQADAKSVYDILFREPEEHPPDGTRQEVGCWSHCRRGFWEAAASKSLEGREGLARIGYRSYL